MKNLRKVLCLALVAVMTCGLITGCVAGSHGTTGTQPQPTDPQPTDPQPTNPQPTDPSAPAEPPKLSSLSVDGGYSITFDPAVNSYSVSIPAGRARVPHVEATAAEGVAITVRQATIADTETVGKAVITAVQDGAVSTYTVEFVKDESLGFQLQYADVYTFVPDYTLKNGESFTFQTSNKNVITVKKSGKLTVNALSDEAVTITAKVNGEVVDELVIDKVIKAPLNVFLIMGQSNALGYHDVPPEYSTYYAYASTQKAICDQPTPGTVWCDDINNGYDDYTFSGMYDLTVGRSGFSPALGKEWYNLTGEKSLMIQTAVGSSPIETWVKNPNLKFFGLDCYNITVERFRYYQELLNAADSNFEINRIYGFWLQGETGMEFVYDPGVFTWAFKHNIPNYEYNGDWRALNGTNRLITSREYSDYLLGMVDSLKEDVGMEFLGVLPVRAMLSVSSRENRQSQQLTDLVPTRAAQFAINYGPRTDIAFVTMKTEIGRTESYADKNAEGWGFMGCNNIHYNQLGYNALGKDAAANTFAMMSGVTDKTAVSMEVLDSNGKDRLTEGDEVVIPKGKTHQISALVLPLYADATELTFTVADTAVCTIDEFGLITAANTADQVGKTTTVTVTNGELTESFTVKVGR